MSKHDVTDLDCDLLIIGAGPVGLFATYYAGFRGLRTVVVDSLPEPGGQISAMYPEKPIFDVAGFPAVKGRDLVDRLVAQAAPFDPVYLLERNARTLELLDDGSLVVTMEDRVEVRASAVVVSAGIGTFTPRPLSAGSGWLGSGVSYFIPELEAHKDQDVVVVGGGDSACDWALALEPLARSVTLVHRRSAFRAHAHTVGQLKNSTVQVITDAEITAVGGAGHVEHVEITKSDGTKLARSADAVIAALGFTANLGPIRNWGMEIVANRYIAVDSAMETNIPGVYAAGDVSDYRGKVRLIAVGFGEAATAVNNAAVRISPEESLFPGHSTDSPSAGR
ncbi:FAD-dependent oxidoreductase [Nocardia sp. R7R-8]|uniref:FAD-dependent oxidoreductase n=1 Tax=Nocardia sp. R7R-8 TaxID=3459304 RepID=UPI00403DBDFE